MPKPTPEEIALSLNALFRQEFGGKKRGKFCIFREELRELAGREKLENSIVNEIGVHLFNNHDLALFDGVDFFGIFAAGPITSRWRQYRGE
ncbi:hypothetical protein JVX96_24380 [Variovorax sp. PDNC026]|uniref:hypothetical protein n=1 Tax=Variovorax sp. PDNC026 TaxID=2811425 RepID=UPI0019629007|nr:hypothetical protein [Variovorax sp. PDNC026]QRY31184.1 hypothetical protein JVX96_24380 [Variovorax sp. PDNC026]